MNFPRIRKSVLYAIAFVGSATALPAHEFWLEPQEFQVETGKDLVVDLRNGQEFVGASLAYFETQFTRFELALGGSVTPVPGRAGDRPAMTAAMDIEGLGIVLHETTPNKVRYTEWEKFVKFATHKDFPDIAARHDALGHARDNFRENYTRHAKALVAVGNGNGSDRAFGLKTEFVALTNPYASDFNGEMTVQLLLDGAPRPDAQVEVFHRDTDDTVSISLHRTDATGVATIPVSPGGDYLFDAVVLEPYGLPEPADVVWQTYWAALTFHVPD